MEVIWNFMTASLSKVQSFICLSNCRNHLKDVDEKVSIAHQLENIWKRNWPWHKIHSKHRHFPSSISNQKPCDLPPVIIQATGNYDQTMFYLCIIFLMIGFVFFIILFKFHCKTLFILYLVVLGLNPASGWILHLVNLIPYILLFDNVPVLPSPGYD